ncbi:MAG: biotin transporter BioY [Oscillospiraceae bacterium]|nr:biotin transporter BioY [Oscillospiraceae bacterium]
MYTKAEIRNKPKLTNMILISLFSVLIIISAWIKLPGPVPFTLQTFGIFCTFGIIGGRMGFYSVLIYILLGLIGMPVFSGFNAGAGVVFGATGGFLAGFLIAAGAYGFTIKLLGNSFAAKIAGMVLGQVVCYLSGTAWYMLVYLHETGRENWFVSVKYCVLPFIAVDILKIILAAVVSEKVNARLKLKNF